MTERVHLSCSPFPTPQGTQAAVASMLRADLARGRVARLFVTDERYGAVAPDPPEVLRLPRGPRALGASSGPSIARVLADARTTLWLRSQSHPLVIAHHVEAALACLASRTRYVYVAHTDLEEELPTYAPRVPRRALAAIGNAIDVAACRGAEAVLAVTPWLANRLEQKSGRPATHLPIPWPSEPAHVAARAASRRALGIADHELVVLHAGNLDGYQGLVLLEEALRELAVDRDVVFLVATESERALASRTRTVRVGLADEAARARAHAASDVVAIARSVRGGLPIKLLDAMARGTPVAVTREALGGLPLTDATSVMRSAATAVDAPRELARAVRTAVEARDELVATARARLAFHHSDDRYDDALERVLARLR